MDTAGFCPRLLLVGSNTVIAYKVTGYYNAECDKGVNWDDPAIGIEWPEVANAETLSPKDQVQPLLADLPQYFSWKD